MKKLFILTGEPSGDKLASEVISKLKKIDPDIEYLSVGGENLDAGEAGGGEFPVTGNGIGSIAVVVDTVRRIIGVGVSLPGNQKVMDPLHQITFIGHGSEVDYGSGTAPDRTQ